MKYQKGIGLVEVMVALLLLAVAILGFTALQLRAVASSIEAGNNVQAVSLARDLAERMRVNPTGMRSVYQAQSSYTTATVSTNCATTVCTAAELAAYDFDQVRTRAAGLGMDIAIRDCQGYPADARRSCVYVAWDETTPTNGEGNTDCTNGTTYRANAKCIILEAYNHE